METYTIRHEVGIKASAEAVYLALTDTKKLAGWWTSDTRGNGSEVGGTIEFWFGDSCHKFEVIGLQPGKLVRWKAHYEEGSEEWAGTEIAFSLSADEKQCFVQFSHSGWRDDRGYFSHSSTKWAVFYVEPQGPSGKRPGTSVASRRTGQPRLIHQKSTDAENEMLAV